jgi:hypothetical protein
LCAVVYGSWQKVGVAGAHAHRVDRDPVAVVEFEDDDLEEVAGSVGAEEERAPRIAVALLERVADERLLDRVADVVVGDSVFPCCFVDLHTRLL